MEKIWGQSNIWAWNPTCCGNYDHKVVVTKNHFAFTCEECKATHRQAIPNGASYWCNIPFDFSIACGVDERQLKSWATEANDYASVRVYPL